MSDAHHDGIATTAAVPFTWKRASHIAVFFVGFVLAFDYSVAVISLQSAWHVVAPQRPQVIVWFF